MSEPRCDVNTKYSATQLDHNGLIDKAVLLLSRLQNEIVLMLNVKNIQEM